jgi:pantetheine-phosphate adenylyltransferase
MGKKIAIYPGTFDPLTLGHADILERACKFFDQVILGIAYNDTKDALFSFKERIEIATNETNRLSLSNAKVIGFEGLLVDFAREQRSRIIIRGIRAVSDFEYEFQMAYINKKLFPELETIFLPASNKGHFISSSLVKEVAKLGGDLKDLVSLDIAKALKEKYLNL